MPKVRILYVVTKLELGGAQKQLLTLINHLDQAKFQPFLFTAKEGLLLQEAVSINGLTVKKSKWLERSINPIKDFLALVEAYFFIKKKNIDFVHTHSSKAGILGRIAARLAKVRIILHTVHGWSFNDYQPKIKRGIFIFLERFCAGFTHKIIVVSRHDKVKGLTHRIGEDKKYNLIRYGIDYEEFKITKGRDFKKELGINSDCLVVGMVSCFKPQKSPHDFIRAASLVHQVMPEVKFILAGDGVLRRDIEELISKFQLKDSIILPGWRRDIPDMLSALDVFILTSLWEGLPIAALEAMSASRAVIATNTGGVAEVVQEGKTGFLVPPKDIKKMAEKLIILLKDENLRKIMGRNAEISLGRDFSFESMINSTQGLYENLLQGKIPNYDN